MTINFPWASLLRGLLGHHDLVLAGVASGSSWAKRLRAGRERPVTLLRFSRT